MVIMGFGKDGKGAMIREIQSVALGTLANVTALKLSTITLGEDFRILKSEILAKVGGLTAGEGDDLLFGICNAELTVAEISEAIVVDGPTNRNDRDGQEKAERNVKILSSSDQVLSAVDRAFLGENGGPMIISKHRWTYSDPEGWAFFVFNNGSALQTGATAVAIATHYGVWVT